jgi:hypothetical protein
MRSLLFFLYRQMRSAPLTSLRCIKWWNGVEATDNKAMGRRVGSNAFQLDECAQLNAFYPIM